MLRRIVIIVVDLRDEHSVRTVARRLHRLPEWHVTIDSMDDDGAIPTRLKTRALEEPGHLTVIEIDPM